VQFLSSSIYAALSMIIVISTLSARFLRHRCDNHFLSNLDSLTVGLAKGGAIAIYVYFILKVIGVAHDNNWHYLNTPYGYWFLVEIFGFVLLPGLLFSLAVKKNSAGIARFAAFCAVVGIVLNRMNLTLITFNWNLPHHLKEITPRWQEFAVVLSIATLHILIFRWILNRMPVLREEPGYDAHYRQP
jgi:Ni/Fe-hydrogenase subunit HybB-like protein